MEIQQLFLSAAHSRHAKTSRRINSISHEAVAEVESFKAEVDELFVSNCRCGLCVMRLNRWDYVWEEIFVFYEVLKCA